jgi:hypothetical protein
MHLLRSKSLRSRARAVSTPLRAQRRWTRNSLATGSKAWFGVSVSIACVTPSYCTKGKRMHDFATHVLSDVDRNALFASIISSVQ